MPACDATERPDEDDAAVVCDEPLTPVPVGLPALVVVAVETVGDEETDVEVFDAEEEEEEEELVLDEFVVPPVIIMPGLAS